MEKKEKNSAATYVGAFSGDEVSSYIRKVCSLPMLDQKREQELAHRWSDSEDVSAAQELVVSHLRIVPKVAMRYRGYGLPLMDMISEGNIGLMRAVKNFDPNRGFRLVTYAVWWVRAFIQDYVLRSWSLVRLTTSSSQKRLFFSIRRLKGKIGAFHREISAEQAQKIAEDLGVSQSEVETMNMRLGGDMSLDTPMASDYDSDSGTLWVDMLPSKNASQESVLSASEEGSIWRQKLAHALKNLKSRERYIFWARRLKETPATLDVLARRFLISRERVRQLENRAFEKVQAVVVSE